MGESISEATIISWLKSVGDYVEAEEIIVEVATDKVDNDGGGNGDGVERGAVVAFECFVAGGVGEIGAALGAGEGAVDAGERSRVDGFGFGH